MPKPAQLVCSQVIKVNVFSNLCKSVRLKDIVLKENHNGMELKTR